jgi:hypothetical protein
MAASSRPSEADSLCQGRCLRGVQLTREMMWSPDGNASRDWSYDLEKLRVENRRRRAEVHDEKYWTIAGDLSNIDSSAAFFLFPA